MALKIQARACTLPRIALAIAFCLSVTLRAHAAEKLHLAPSDYEMDDIFSVGDQIAVLAVDLSSGQATEEALYYPHIKDLLTTPNEPVASRVVSGSGYADALEDCDELISLEGFLPTPPKFRCPRGAARLLGAVQAGKQNAVLYMDKSLNRTLLEWNRPSGTLQIDMHEFAAAPERRSFDYYANGGSDEITNRLSRLMFCNRRLYCYNWPRDLLGEVGEDGRLRQTSLEELINREPAAAKLDLEVSNLAIVATDSEIVVGMRRKAVEGAASPDLDAETLYLYSIRVDLQRHDATVDLLDTIPGFFGRAGIHTVADGTRADGAYSSLAADAGNIFCCYGGILYQVPLPQGRSQPEQDGPTDES